MLIAYRDFIPAVTQPGIFYNEYEAFPETVARANDWLTEAGVELINIETVLLPNVGHSQNSAQTGIRTSGEMSSWWYQVVRIWYKSNSA